MNDVLVIEGTQIEKIEYQGQPVLSLPMVDKVHRRPEGTAGRNFRQNRKRFVEGVDFYELGHEIWSGFIRRNSSNERGNSSDEKAEKRGRGGSMIFLTLSGYLMLAKSFTDDLSWKVQRMLIDSYFRLRELIQKAGDIEVLKVRAEKADHFAEELLKAKDKIIDLQDKYHSKYRYKGWTKEDRETLKKLAAEGLNYLEVAETMKRNKSSVCHYYHKFNIPLYPNGKPEENFVPRGKYAK